MSHVTEKKVNLSATPHEGSMTEGKSVDDRINFDLDIQ
jgi:hypothetical protein